MGEGCLREWEYKTLAPSNKPPVYPNGGKMFSKKDWSVAEENTLLKLKDKGISYLEIAEIMQRTPDSLRKKYWLLKHEKNTEFEKTARVLIFDIETSLSIFTAFSTGVQYLGDRNILQDYYVISWSAKWLGEDEVYSDVITPKESKKADDKRVLRGLWKLLDEADIVIGHNSDKFDLKKVNTRFILNGMDLPRPYKSIDTLKLARKMFSFSSNKLDYLCKMFGLEGKTEHSGYQLWLDCLKGDKKALAEIVEYNRNDVVILENLYNVLKQGITKPIKLPRYGSKAE